MTTRLTNSSLFIQGTIDSLPLVFAAIPFGIIFGALSIEVGLSVWETVSMSFYVFAGSSQFIAVTLIDSSAPFSVILLTVFIVNLRHMLYSANLMKIVARLPQKIRIPMSFWLTDETFAVVSKRITRDFNEDNIHWYFLGSAFAMYTMWTSFTIFGIFLSQQLPDLSSWGLEVAMIVGFIAIIVPNLKFDRDWICVGTAVLTTIVTYQWPNQTGLLFSSILAIIAAVLFELYFQSPEDSKNG